MTKDKSQETNTKLNPKPEIRRPKEYKAFVVKCEASNPNEAKNK